MKTMAFNLEAAVRQESLEEIGHDITHIDEEKGIYGVFDGAGAALPAAYASAVIEDRYDETDLDPYHLRPEKVLEYAHSKLRELFNSEDFIRYKDLLRTTASIIRIKKLGHKAVCSFAAAGDSPIYHYSD